LFAKQCTSLIPGPFRDKRKLKSSADDGKEAGTADVPLYSAKAPHEFSYDMKPTSHKTHPQIISGFLSPTDCKRVYRARHTFTALEEQLTLDDVLTFQSKAVQSQTRRSIIQFSSSLP
jgi:hypothetical protein